MTGPDERVLVLFDLDDTLMAHREAVERGIAGQLRATAYDADATAAAALWHALEEQHYHAYLEGSLSFEGQRRARARDFAAAHGHTLDEEEAGAWFASYFERYRAAWALHDDALDALDAVTRAFPGVRLGIITNGEHDFQAAKLERLGLSQRFEQLIASGALGVAKPDRRIFEVARERFTSRAPVDAVAYVGDRLRTDAIGASAAGFTGIWLNRTGAEPAESDAREAARLGVIEIASLHELAPRLRDALTS